MSLVLSGVSLVVSGDRSMIEYMDGGVMMMVTVVEVGVVKMVMVMVVVML